MIKRKFSILNSLVCHLPAGLLILVLSACGGGGGGGSGGGGPKLPQVTLQGVVHKGPINGAVVSLYEINAAGERVYLKDVQTDASGFYTLTLSVEAARSYVVQTKGGSYLDVATANTVQLTDSDQLAAYVTLDNNAPLTRTLNVTPISTLAGAYTDYLVSSGSKDMSQAIAEGHTIFNRLFNLTENSQSSSIPATKELTELNVQRLNLVGLLAGFDQWAKDDQTDSAMVLIKGLTQDVREDGIVGNVDSALSLAKLIEAAERFVAGFTSNQINQLVVADAVRQAEVNLAQANFNIRPVANKDLFSTLKNETLVLDAAALLENDSDQAGDQLVVKGVKQTAVAGSQVTLDKNVITYIPATDYAGTDSFSYEIVDQEGLVDEALVTIIVRDAITQPLAIDDEYSINEDAILTLSVAELLANDLKSIYGNIRFTKVITENVTSGQLSVSGNTLTYEPKANFFGEDHFLYEIEDEQSNRSQAKVKVAIASINDEPIALIDSFSTDEDKELQINVASLLANDSDIDGDTLVVTEVIGNATTQGSVSLNNDVILFAPKLNFNGATSFDYFVEDLKGGRTKGTVNITVTAVNDDPVLVLDKYETLEDTDIDITFASLLSNDSDAENDTLSVTGAKDAVNGTVVIANATGFVFSPSQNFAGLASFQYTVSDGRGGSFSGQVEINVTPVNDPPVAVADSASTEAYTSLTLTPLANDYDVEDDALTITSVDKVTANGGSVSITGAGKLLYKSPSGFVGTDSFNYTISDSKGASSSAKITINVYSEVGNLTGYAHATCSSESASTGQLCLAAIDGVLQGDSSGNREREWASAGEKVGATIQLSWMKTVIIDSVTLHDRPNSNDRVMAGELQFSDGSKQSVGALANNGSAVVIDFEPKSVSWVKFVVTEVSSATNNAGLMEMIATGEISPLKKALNEALYARVSSSYDNTSLNQITDGVVAVASNGWMSNGTGDYVRLEFAQPQKITKVSLRGLIRETSQINAATLSFSDGTDLPTGGISKIGDLHEFSFPAKEVNWLQFTIGSGVGPELGLSELAVFRSLASQNILSVEQFRYSGKLRQWTTTDNGIYSGPSFWQVQQGRVEQTKFINSQTTDGYDIGTYALADTININEFDLMLNLRGDKVSKFGAGYVGVIFGYQNDNNYYRLSLSPRKGHRKLEKKVEGVFSELATSTQSYTVNQWSNARIVKQNGLIVVYINGQQALAAKDSSFGQGKIGVWCSRGDLALFDNLALLTPPSSPVLGMLKPYEFGLITDDKLDLDFTVTAPVGGVEFVINEGMAGEYSETLLAEPYQSTVYLNSQQNHQITAYLLDDKKARMVHAEAKVFRPKVGLNGIHLMSFGDSITEGLFDNTVSDDVSIDGRNTSGGYEPVLNNRLTTIFNQPVSVENEGNPGDKITQALPKIQAILAKGNIAQGYLLMFGTNDSNEGVSDVTYKENLRVIVQAIVDAGARVWIAKPPPRFGQVAQNNRMETYHLRINELVSEFASSHPGKVKHGPNFYVEFENHLDWMDSDKLHPNGLGYSNMGQLWADVLESSL